MGPEASLRTTATRELINRLRQEIYGGVHLPGARLRQGALATRFGVSTTPVREALSALQAEGLVTVDPHRGAVVVQPSPDDVRESFAIREVLETLALESAIPVISDAELDQLQAYIHEMQGVSTYEAWAQLNETFHRELYEASRRRRLCDLIESLRVSSQHFIASRAFGSGTRRRGRCGASGDPRRVPCSQHPGGAGGASSPHRPHRRREPSSTCPRPGSTVPT